MSKLSDKKDATLGSLAAVQAVTEKYPELSNVSSISVSTSCVGLLLDILHLLGVNEKELINWVSNLLSGINGKSGVLEVIEQAIKAVLLANIKDMWSCSVDPILPDSLMRYSNPYDEDGNAKKDPYSLFANISDETKFKKIEIDLNQIDMFGILNNCPSDPKGSMFYFDSYDSMEGIKGESKPYLNANNLWKSCDFNAYLWYVINKGSTSNYTDLQRATWDNRNQMFKKYSKDKNLKNNFFDTEIPKKYYNQTKIPITNKTEEDGNVSSKDITEISKKQILICEFNERVTPTANENSLPSSNILRCWINANRYYKTRKIKIKKKEFALNKTIFEFNYDYIYSLKLFDTKSLISQIINSLLGLSASVEVNASLEVRMIEAKVSEIVDRVIKADDMSSSDCYYNFSNEQYDSLINEATEKYNGTYFYGGSDGLTVPVNSEEILNSIMNLDCSGDLIEQSSNISKLLEEVITKVGEPGKVDISAEFSFGFNFVTDFIKQTIKQIVLQILTPKVALLFLINGAVMGSDVAQIKNWENFIKNFQNVLVAIIKQVKDIMVEQLFNFVMEKLKPILEIFMSKLALEAIQYYKDLIEDLILNCLPSINLSFGKGSNVIDNVDYADITSFKEPSENKC